MSKKLNYQVFPVTVFEEGEKISETLTKARLRTFYKGKNRNMSFISDEFANQLLSTIAYAPVKGIYQSDTEDFGAHGEPSDGKIYGVVPENPNFAWEWHIDEDLIEREYACVDVYLYTGLYEKESKKIIGSSQSMELFGPSIEGAWQEIDEDEFFVFTRGSFLGLQVLGKETLPCFEGAAFYSLENIQMLNLFTALYEKFDELLKVSKEGGKDNMEDLKLDQNIEPEVVEVFEEEVIEAAVEATVEAEVVTEAVNEPDEVLEIIETNFVELQQEIATLKAENETAQKQISDLTEELNILREYKKSIEVIEKNSILSKYEEHLDTAQIEEMREKLDSYTALELDKELSYILVKSAKNVFSQESAPYVPKDEGITGDLVSILSKYKK